MGRSREDERTLNLPAVEELRREVPIKHCGAAQRGGAAASRLEIPVGQ